MHVIATAGHVDHGKSTLVQALTGIDPDRLEEEKRRGLTIDLGFAWLRLPSGREVGIVDVPGHERFIKNMLAGVGAINVTLFIVAANEGWKPQSQEHLDILDLLGVRAAVVALTKADTVEPARVDEVAGDVGARIASTSLAGSAVIPVAVPTRRGLDALVKEIDALLDRTPPARDLGRPRLWIDRVFSMKGSGTVVTGTLIDGPLEQGQRIEVLPVGATGRIRSIQSHRKRVERISPGNRTALNLVGIDPERLVRGEVISAPGLWRTTNRAIVGLNFLPHIGFEPSERGAFKFHVGSAEADAKIAFIDGISEGRAYALITLDEPVVLDWRDKFVIREAGRRMTIGGGVILEPHPASFRRGDSALSEAIRRREVSLDRSDYLDLILEEEGSLTRGEIRARTGLDAAELEGRDGIWLPTRVFSTTRFAQLERALIAAVRDYQMGSPLEAGMARAATRAALDLDPRTFDELAGELVRRGAIIEDEEVLHTPEHLPAVGGPDRDSLLSELESTGASPPTTGELQGRYDPGLIRALVRAGELIQVSPELVYPAARLEQLKLSVEERMRAGGPMTVAAFRDLIGTTRKYAVPLLEYLDQIGFTRRQGDVRVLGPKAEKLEESQSGRFRKNR